MSAGNVVESIEELNRVFHHEADFQHALAWHIHQQYPDARLRLERRFPGEKFPGLTEDVYIDIWLELDGDAIPIELKYKPDTFRGEWGDESFDLRRHSAQDVARYDFISDIARVETAVAAEECSYGAVVLLTNDHLYWQPPTRDDVVDYEFRLNDGKILEGELSWAEDVGAGTVGKKRDQPIKLNETYELDWRNYDYDIPSDPEESDDFRYLFVKVE
ncbi:hypothetical protein C477_05777 [Haloterrigena salina JCM 13891]|uniref:Uncharacterized protein n=1 Tax=Haloterrigena salina JCM 13891 TaxID=1227488 RepID=M0CEB8_9EURY|nr:hypothetical protein [Haloterrigena salina]ELZ20983.1 hypothetical protein C477_05777 [Haloterrigena salina JCM 13891]